MADLLLVEPDAPAADTMAAVLRKHGHQVRIVRSVSSAFDSLEEQEPDAILTELALPDMDGLVFVSDLSRFHPRAALLVMSGQPKPADHVLALRLGADDVMVKPIDPRELVTRVEVVLRRLSPSEPARAPAVIEVDELVIDQPRRTVTCGGAEVHLTPIEYRVLLVLVRHVNDVVSRDTLMREVWGYIETEMQHMVDVHINRLRPKLKAGRSPALVTIRGRGFMLRTASSHVEEVL